jgi:hypothetical protein
MSTAMYNIIRDFGGFFIALLVLIIFAILLITGNPGAEFFKEWVGLILAAYLVADRGLKVVQGRQTDKYTKDE